jgi:flagellar biosynthesis GTPase FlhF
MKISFTHVWASVVFLVAISAASHAFAQFARSEDELMAADINEARRRASDFKNHLALVKKRKEIQDSIGPEEVKKVRAEFERLREMRREAFVKERNARPVPKEEAILRLELAHDRLREDREREMEKYRLRFLEKRDRVRATIRREGYIDERLEFDM